MSTKAERRRIEFERREAERKRKEELKKDWKCPCCRHLVHAISPICLCGCRRPNA